MLDYAPAPLTPQPPDPDLHLEYGQDYYGRQDDPPPVDDYPIYGADFGATPQQEYTLDLDAQRRDTDESLFWDTSRLWTPAAGGYDDVLADVAAFNASVAGSPLPQDDDPGLFSRLMTRALDTPAFGSDASLRDVVETGGSCSPCRTRAHGRRTTR